MNYRGIDFKWDIEEREKKFIDHLIDNGYEILKHKQWISKTVYTIKKDSVETKWEWTPEYRDMDYFIKFFERNFEMTKQIKEMREIQYKKVEEEI